MSWNSHIEKVCDKAMFQLYMLERLLRYADREAKMAAYKSLIFPVIKYASTLKSRCNVSGCNGFPVVTTLGSAGPMRSLIKRVH